VPGQFTAEIPGLPVSEEHVRINEGNFRQQSQRAFLLCGEFGAEVGDNSVVASEHAAAGAYLKGFATSHVGDLYFFSGFGISEVLDAYGGAAQTKSNR
jgi:hypothetical protein